MRGKPDADARNDGTQPTCTREALEKPRELEGSAMNDAVNGTTVTDIAVPPGKICVAVCPMTGVVFMRLGVIVVKVEVKPGGRNPPQVWSRSSSFES
jgi:hypothetical protein